MTIINNGFQSEWFLQHLRQYEKKKKKKIIFPLSLSLIYCGERLTSLSALEFYYYFFF